MHFARNVLAHAGRNGRRVVAAFIATAFAQNDAEAAKSQWRKVADQLRPTLPKLAALMDEAETDVLAYMTFPAAHRTKLHSVNPLERLNGEIKRRTDVVGIFPNEAAITRLVGALLLEQSDEWAVQRARYMTLETIGSARRECRPSACQPWPPDQPGPAGHRGDQRQLHHARGHDPVPAARQSAEFGLPVGFQSPKKRSSCLSRNDLFLVGAMHRVGSSPRAVTQSDHRPSRPWRRLSTSQPDHTKPRGTRLGSAHATPYLVNLLLPRHRQWPLQPFQHHPLVRPAAEDRLDDVRRQQRQPQDPTDVALADPLRLGDLSHRAIDARSSSFCHRHARASALTSTPSGNVCSSSSLFRSLQKALRSKCRRRCQKAPWRAAIAGGRRRTPRRVPRPTAA